VEKWKSAGGEGGGKCSLENAGQASRIMQWGTKKEKKAENEQRTGQNCQTKAPFPQSTWQQKGAPGAGGSRQGGVARGCEPRVCTLHILQMPTPTHGERRKTRTELDFQQPQSRQHFPC